MAKGQALSLGMISMYEGLLDDEFKPVMAILEARSKAIEPRVRVQVKKDLGVYDLLLKKAALEEQLRAVESELEDKVGNEKNSWLTKESEVEKETKRRLEEENVPLASAQAFQHSLKKSIRLSGATSEVQSMFSKLAVEIKKLKEDTENLPPIEWKPTKSDRKLLSLEGFNIPEEEK